MEETKEEEKQKFPIVSATIMIVVLFVVAGLLAYTMQDSMYQYAIEKAGKDIDCCMNNVSDDYIQGWKDCIKRINKYATENLNITAGVIK